MNRRQSLGVLGVGLVAKPSDSRPAELAQMATLTVRIVPTSYREKTGRAIELYRPSQHFYVVVTNVSDAVGPALERVVQLGPLQPLVPGDGRGGPSGRGEGSWAEIGARTFPTGKSSRPAGTRCGR